MKTEVETEDKREQAGFIGVKKRKGPSIGSRPGWSCREGGRMPGHFFHSFFS